MGGRRSTWREPPRLELNLWPSSCEATLHHRGAGNNTHNVTIKLLHWCPFSHATPKAWDVDGLFCWPLLSTQTPPLTNLVHFKLCKRDVTCLSFPTDLGTVIILRLLAINREMVYSWTQNSLMCKKLSASLPDMESRCQGAQAPLDHVSTRA